MNCIALGLAAKCAGSLGKDQASRHDIQWNCERRYSYPTAPWVVVLTTILLPMSSNAQLLYAPNASANRTAAPSIATGGIAVSMSASGGSVSGLWTGTLGQPGGSVGGMIGTIS